MQESMSLKYDLSLAQRARNLRSRPFVLCSLALRSLLALQGYLAHKKTPPPRTLQ